MNKHLKYFIYLVIGFLISFILEINWQDNYDNVGVGILAFLFIMTCFIHDFIYDSQLNKNGGKNGIDN